ncbi:MAG TPA: hypothetical protein VGE52_01485 [Pirellulales bacterium]
MFIAVCVCAVLAADPESELPPVAVERYIATEQALRAAEVGRLINAIRDVEESASKDKAKQRRALEEQLRKAKDPDTPFYPLLEVDRKSEPGVVGHVVDPQVTVKQVLDEFTMIVVYRYGPKGNRSMTAVLSGRPTGPIRFRNGAKLPVIQLRDPVEFTRFDTQRDMPVLTVIDGEEIKRWRKASQRE